MEMWINKNHLLNKIIGFNTGMKAAICGIDLSVIKVNHTAMISITAPEFLLCATVSVHRINKKTTDEADCYQSHCWKVSVNLVRAFKEAVSNWVDLDLFVVRGRLK